MIPVSVIMVTKNEEENIIHSLPPLIRSFDEVIVVDSHSEDQTATIAKEAGATVHAFDWNGQYPKKRQWCLDKLKTKHDWVLMLDADEIATDAFIEEVKALDFAADGYFVKSSLVWQGKPLKFGMKNNKLCLFKKSAFAFPVIDDLDLPGMGEMEGHYQPVPKQEGRRIGQIKSSIRHNSLKDDWQSRHDRYAEWEIAMNKRNAWPLDPVYYRELIKDLIRYAGIRPHLYFIWSYIILGGFLDGKEGLDYTLKRFSYNRHIVRVTQQTNELR